MRIARRRRAAAPRTGGEDFAGVDRPGDDQAAGWVAEALRSGEAPDAVLGSSQVRALRLAADGAGGYRSRDVDAFVEAVAVSLRYYELMVTELVTELGEARSALDDVQGTVELLRTADGRVLADSSGRLVTGIRSAGSVGEFADVESWLTRLAAGRESADASPVPFGWTVTGASATAAGNG